MKKNFTEEDYTFLEEVIRTFRYPDGTLNKIAVFISTLALVLILVVGHFMIKGIQNVKKMKTVSASELTMGEIEKYITDSYLDEVADYANTNMDHETAKRNILKHISTYLSNSSVFTEQQKTEIENTISQYLDTIQLQDSINDNQNAIQEINQIFNQYISENQLNLENVKNELQSQINDLENNSTAESQETAKQLKQLKELNANIQALELTHYNELNDLLKSYYEQLNRLNADATQQLDNQNEILDLYGNRIQRLEDRTTALDKTKEFQFDYRNGAYGYTVDDTFRPY
ncbi:MAG: hypothetical protein IKP29_06470 [Pseudobutyrivibrio sp.]|nr:hypothetical protein [Pseudobutyrivibrio sp.]